MEKRDIFISLGIGLIGAALFNITWAIQTAYYLAAVSIFGVLGYGIVSLVKNLKQ